ncbi:MAG TPA: ATP-binding cassette domain-containing protein, partial [Acidimicrobiia bacterium]
AGLGRSFQDARLWPSLTVEHAITVAFERHHAARAAVGAMLALPVAVDAEAAVRDEALALIDRFGLGAFRNKFVAELSTGTRRIVEIATLTAHRPRVLLLDEPSSGIAQKEAEALVPLLRDLRATLGCTLVVIDHDIALITELADRLVALDQGRIIATGPPGTVIDDPEVAASFLGARPSDRRS